MNIIIKIFFFLALLLLSPLIILIMLIVFFEDGLPVIFIQKRLGINKQVMDLYKIRTMKNSTPNVGTHEINESSLLASGNLLRITKIDELPQIINFIKGEISIVGPRPGLPNQFELNKFRESFGIFQISPGITGLSQVLGYDMSNPELLARIDRLYIEKKTVKLDLMIFISTFLSFFRKYIRHYFKKEIMSIHKEMGIKSSV